MVVALKRVWLSAGLTIACASPPLAPPSNPDPARTRESVEVEVPAEDLNLVGTFERPAATNPPAVVLVHGSGPNSRDQRVGGQLGMQFGFEIAMFEDLADALAERGIASLRYDKRSCGRFNGCADNAYPPPDEDLDASVFVSDATAAVDWAASQPDLGPIYVLGHSQGALFVPFIMQTQLDVAGGIMVAAPHSPMDAIIAAQRDFLRTLLQDQGLAENAIDAHLAELSSMIDDLAELRDGAFVGERIGGASVQFWRSMFEYAERVDAVARALDSPLAMIGGGYDWNVPPDELAAWREVLTGRGQTRFFEIECMTHALNCIRQPDHRRINPQRDIERSVHDELVDVIDTLVRSESSR